MVTTLLTATATSTGTGTTKITLNGGNNVTIPDVVREMMTVVPYVIPSAALTVDESVETNYTIESDDVKVNPTVIGVFSIAGGDAAFATGLAPKMVGYDINVPLQGSESIKFSGTSLAANTAAMLNGMGLVVSTGRTGKPQKFWTNPAALTAIGTAAATVTGSSYSFSGGRRITDVYGWMAPATAAASDSVGGRISLVSNDYETSLPITFPVQTIAIALGSAAVGLNAGQARFNVNIPVRNNVEITENISPEQAVAGNGTAMTGIAYTQR